MQSMPFDQFVAKYRVITGDDLTCPDVETKLDGSQLSRMRTAYLHKVLQGTHIVGRDFAYMTSVLSSCNFLSPPC